MEDRLELAVNTALSGSSDLKQEAIQYCNLIKDSPDGWKTGMALFVDTSKQRSDSSRFFSLQVIDSALPNLSRQDLISAQTSLFSYIRSATTSSTHASPIGEAFLRNKISQTLSYIFILTYGDIWPTFFDDLLATLSPDFSNDRAVDLYLRILNSIHDEIGNNLIVRDQETTKRNNALKDLVRERAVTRLAESWKFILQAYKTGNSNDKIRKAIIENCLKVVGGWVSWIDITLIVNPSYLQIIFDYLSDGDQRLTTCDTLLEIISKKMKPGDKFELLELLNLKHIISQISSSGEEDAEFDERVAKLSNVVAIELVHILDGSTSTAARVPLTPDISQKAEALLVDFMPTIIHFLSNEYDDTSSQVFPCIGDYLVFVRAESKQAKASIDTSKMQRNKDTGYIVDFPPDSNFIPPTRREILQLLLTKLIIKMRYDSDVSWTGGDDESESEFLDIRSRLKILQDQVASIDMDLYIDGIVSIVTNSFNPSAVSSWQDVELGLFELGAFSESLRNGAVAVVKGVENRASQTLYELFFKMIESNVVSMNHPSIQLHYMELVNRHSMFFSASNSHALVKVLESFVSPLGIHNANRRVQVRSWYLFFRFVKSVRSILRANFAEMVFSSIQSLLQIKAEIPVKDDNDSEISGSEAAGAGSFDSQLYLFELCGLLLSNHRPSPPTNENRNTLMINDPNDNALKNNTNLTNTNNSTTQNTVLDNKKQLELMRQLLQPIYSDVEQYLTQANSNDPLVPLQVHHDVMAIGTFARGFNDIGTGAGANSDNIISNSGGRTMDAGVAEEFRTATRVVITSLERLGNAEVIRDAARFSISRLIPVLGTSILPEVTRLISCLLELSKLEELSDFLGFLGQLVHNFRTEAGVYGMFDTLMIPLISRITQALSKADQEAVASGGATDASILKRELRKAYLTFFYNLLNNGMGSILFSEKNVQKIYESVLQSLLVYSGDFESDSASAKVAVLSLNKMLQIWKDGENYPESPVAGNGKPPVPGFKQFTLQHISRITWEIPTKASFNPRDAQMRNLLGDLATVQREIFLVYGDVYVQFLSTQYLPSIGLPAEYVTEYIKNLQTLNGKQFKTFYTQMISALK